jgi:hypothetical protein
MPDVFFVWNLTSELVRKWLAGACFAKTKKTRIASELNDEGLKV